MPRTAFTSEELALIRRAFGRQMLAVSGIVDPRLEAAFAEVARERFLGPAPWTISGPSVGYAPLPVDDPVVLYQDVLVALAAEKGVNNGSPSLHARWLHALAPQDGERIVHVGAGTGYYTALLARLVGRAGHVLAVEFDPVLAARASNHLQGYPNVAVVSGDGAEWPREPVDGVYVNAAVERPAELWIENLAEGGRLVFPLGIPRPRARPVGGIHSLYGAGFCVTRQRNGYGARFLGPASFICAEGALSQPTDRDGLKAAFERGGIEFAQSLIWRRAARPDRCWFAGSGWALSYDAVAP